MAGHGHQRVRQRGHHLAGKALRAPVHPDGLHRRLLRLGLLAHGHTHLLLRGQVRGVKA